MSVMLLLSACNGDQSFQELKPDILARPEVLDFGGVVADYTSDGLLEIINSGQGRLDISDITVTSDTPGVFELGDWPLNIETKTSYNLPISFTPPDPLPYSATLTVYSNDEDDPEYAVTLTGNGLNVPTPDIDCTPTSLDFGTVVAGNFGTDWITCENIGDDELSITGTTMAGSGEFDLMTDPTGFTLGPGESVQIILMYGPTAESGANGTLTLTSNDPDEPTLDFTLLGNGGGDYEYPIAVVDCPTDVHPRTTVIVAGGDSYDPNGYEPLTFYWSATGPDEPDLIETGTDVYATLQLAGTYTVSLQVENSQGILSAPAVCRMESVPEELLHVELIWKDEADLDLHLLQSGGTLFAQHTDCNYCDPNPEWGDLLSDDDDPVLAFDSYGGSATSKENINIDVPAADIYEAKVHYFGDGGSAGDVTATVNVYLNGVLETTYSKVLAENDVWDVSQIVWPDAYVVEGTTELYEPEYRTCYTP